MDSLLLSIAAWSCANDFFIDCNCCYKDFLDLLLHLLETKPSLSSFYGQNQDVCHFLRHLKQSISLYGSFGLSLPLSSFLSKDSLSSPPFFYPYFLHKRSALTSSCGWVRPQMFVMEHQCHAPILRVLITPFGVVILKLTPQSIMLATAIMNEDTCMVMIFCICNHFCLVGRAQVLLFHSFIIIQET